MDSPRTSSGIFHDRMAGGESCQLTWREREGEESKSVILHSGREFWNKSIESSILKTRGWAFQEALLPFLTLLFSQQMIAWECYTLQLDEAQRHYATHYKAKDKIFLFSKIPNKRQRLTRNFLTSNILRRAYTRRISPRLPFFEKFHDVRLVYDRWYEFASAYKERNLTIPTDVLPALSGLAAMFQRFLPDDEYCAGLWKRDILRGLMWYSSWNASDPDNKNTCQTGGGLSANPVSQSHAPEVFLTPTWSWASIPSAQNLRFIGSGHHNLGRVEYFEQLCEEATILSISTTIDPLNPFGQVSAGHLIVKGPVWELANPFLPKDQRMQQIPSSLSLDLRQLFTPGILEPQRRRSHPSQKFLVLQLVSTREALPDAKSYTGGGYFHSAAFLVLESTGWAEDEIGELGSGS